MGRTPCCDKKRMKKGPWTPEEDEILVDFIKKNGHGSWRSLPKLAGLLRCGKSCRLRWTNYLRPDIKRGPFTPEEEKLVIRLHSILGNRWAAIASQLSGRTDNEIKNLWNTHLKKRLISMGIDPKTHQPSSINALITKNPPPPPSSTRHMAQWETARLEAEARLSKESSSFLSNPPLPSTPSSDHFLRLWNSEIGESFRNFRNHDGRFNKIGSRSPASQASSSAKCGSVSGTTTEMGVVPPGFCGGGGGSGRNDDDDVECKSKKTSAAAGDIDGGDDDDDDNAMDGSDSFSSNEFGDDLSDTELQLLLDFPGDNDMSFLEHDGDDYATCPTVFF